jgi:hypothetical protein
MGLAKELTDDLKQLQSLAEQYRISKDDKKSFKAFKDKLNYIINKISQNSQVLGRDASLLITEIGPLQRLEEGQDIDFEKIKIALQIISGVGLMSR